MPLIPETIRVQIRWAIIRLQSRAIFKHLFRWGCRLGAWRVSQLLLRITAVEAVYSRHTHPAYPSFVPGHSDLDVTMVLAEESVNDPDQIEAVSRKVETLSWFHFYLNPQDVRFTSGEELARLTRKYRSRCELLYTPDDWILMSGKEMRTQKGHKMVAAEVPWHPEFNRWWQHMLQEYLLVPRPGLEDRYLRFFYRSALRQKLQFLAASGKEAVKLLGHVDDELVETAFRDEPELRSILTEAKKCAFWVKEPRRVKEQILRGILQSAVMFFETYPLHPSLDPAPSPSGEDTRQHGSAYDALESKVERCPRLKSQLRGVITYPVPYSHPYFYQVDLVISDTLSPEHFSETVRAAQETFGGREFFLNGNGYAITFVFETILKWPLLFLGSPYPFLQEHIRRYGKCLFGPEPSSLHGAFGRDQLVAWCRIFLPYYIFNIARRIEYSSRSVNFSQLAGIRLFLETGERETDSGPLRRRHRELFGEESPEERIWDYLLHDKPERANRYEYGEAMLTLLRECRFVEALIDKHYAPKVS